MLAKYLQSLPIVYSGNLMSGPLVAVSGKSASSGLINSLTSAGTLKPLVTMACEFMLAQSATNNFVY